LKFAQIVHQHFEHFLCIKSKVINQSKNNSKIMSKRVRYQISTTINNKQRHISMLSDFNVIKLSTQRNKSGDQFLLFTIKTEIDQVRFESHAKSNNLTIQKI
jgi:hypothetical protein